MKENQNPKKVTYEMYQKAMDENAEKSQKQLKYVGLFIFLFFAQLFGGIALGVSKSVYFVSFLIVSGAVWVILFSFLVLKSLRCPNCGKFFPKGKLKLIDSVKGHGEVWGTSGDFQYYNGPTFVYWTACKSCAHIIWVLKSRKRKNDKNS